MLLCGPFMGHDLITCPHKCLLSLQSIAQLCGKFGKRTKQSPCQPLGLWNWGWWMFHCLMKEIWRDSDLPGSDWYLVLTGCIDPTPFPNLSFSPHDSLSSLPQEQIVNVRSHHEKPTWLWNVERKNSDLVICSATYVLPCWGWCQTEMKGICLRVTLYSVCLMLRLCLCTVASSVYCS